MPVHFDWTRMAPERVFYALGDEPILFTCVDGAGIRYLCSCCRLCEEWVACRASAAALADMADGRLSIREVFENSGGPRFFVAWDGARFEITEDIPDGALPRAGAMLDLGQGETGPCRTVL